MKRVIAACLALLCVAAVTHADDAWDSQVAEYRATQKRPSLWKRTLGREAIAATRDRRAIEILAADYAKPEKPKDQVQYLCASIATLYFSDKDSSDALDAWRVKHTRAEDAWLWYRVLRLRQTWQGPEAVAEIAKNPELDIFLRAAAVEAIALRTDDGNLELIQHLLNNLPDDKMRWVLVESCMGTLRWQVSRLDSDAFRLTANQFANMLEQDSVPEHTKYVIAREFKKMFAAEHSWLTAAPWLKRIAGETGRVPSRTLAQPTFLGLQAEGTRICYVIDMSDSMLTPLTEQEKQDLKNPVTGHSKHDDPDGEKPKPNVDPDIEALPWDKIVTRFDAAREFLKLSLRKLTSEQEFAVVWFGTEADLMEASRGMQKVTEKRIEKIIEELDAIKPGKPNSARSQGTLRGLTNLHGGVQRAFQVKGKGTVKDYEYVDWVTFTQGPDTIFLLSDGKQSWSDWDSIDSTDSADVAGDPENGGDVEGGGDHAELHFYGPYVDERHLLDDVRRMNLFRKCEIHCIGIGEAESRTLKAIANIGGGNIRLIGR